jgi:hypothetical protein
MLRDGLIARRFRPLARRFGPLGDIYLANEV